jgi:hypothetical protein
MAAWCLLLGLSGHTEAAGSRAELFDSEGFWKALPYAPGMREAWQKGVRWNSSAKIFAVYAEGKVYGFAARSIPVDKDPSTQAKLKAASAQRAEMQAINAAGVFAFNHFPCPALAEYELLKADLNLCSSINLSAKISSAWEGEAFSIVEIPATEVCSCKKALDDGLGENNSGTFYGAIARAEVKRLYDGSSHTEVVDFFDKNSSRKIFLADELILVAASSAKLDRQEKAKTILDAVLSRYSQSLDSDQMERCGDIYYSIGLHDSAITAYESAQKKLYKE